jgi:hypothetical protein
VIPAFVGALLDMLKFNAAAFYRVTVSWRHIWTMLSARGWDQHKETSDGVVVVEFLDDPVVLDAMREQARELQSSLLTLGTRQTSKSADRLISLVRGRFTGPQLVGLLREIDSRLRDELSDVTVLTLSPKEQGYFEPAEALFGNDFETKFPSGLFELDEAAKCIALGRGTSAVFHLMRLMEIGVRAVAQSLQIPDPLGPAQRNWGAVLKKIRDAIDQKWPTATNRMAGDGQIFEALYASLDAVKNPWRNATMHVENKYTDEEAEHIFVAVSGFTKKLASRMDEDGNPKA